MGTHVVSLITGIIFGACLVLAGLADPDRIARALRLKDMYIFRAIILCLLVALVGTWLIEMIGTTEIENKPAAILTLTIGGLLIGAGLGLTGYTPGTCLAGAASGRIDAVITILGMFFGAYFYVFLYPSAVQPLEIVNNFSESTLPEITGISKTIWIIVVFSAGIVVLIFTWVINIPGTKSTVKDKKTISNKQLTIEEVPEPMIDEDSFPSKTDFFDSAQTVDSWRKLLFFIILFFLILQQISFWLIHQGYIKQESLTGESVITENVTNLPVDITFEDISTLINLSNTVLIASMVLYVLTTFFCLSSSISACLGGLRYISRAFFSALVALILLLPWQIYLGPTLFGAIYTLSELNEFISLNMSQTSAILLYLRFVGYWTIVTLLLVRSQIYSAKWKKTLFNRIEQII